MQNSLRPGTDLHGSIELGGEEFTFTGKVAWAKRGEPRMNIRGRFGVCFTGISNAFFQSFKSTYQAGASTAG